MTIERLIKVLRWNIIGSKRELRRSFIGLTTAFCIITATQNISAWSDHFTTYANTLSSARLCYFGTGFAMLLWASQVCFNMATKTTFINFAMLPATNAEKFAANILYQTVCRICLAMAAFIATDILQAIISIVFAGSANSLCMCLIDDLNAISNPGECLGIITMMLFVHSTFILGGTFFRRRQFLLTCLVWVFVPFLFSLLAGGGMAAIAYYIGLENYDISITPWFSEETYKMLGMITLMAIVCFVYWLSYIFFRRTQVINNRFFN